MVFNPDDSLHLPDDGFFVCFRVLGCTKHDGRLGRWRVSGFQDFSIAALNQFLNNLKLRQLTSWRKDFSQMTEYFTASYITQGNLIPFRTTHGVTETTCGKKTTPQIKNNHVQVIANAENKNSENLTI